MKSVVVLVVLLVASVMASPAFTADQAQEQRTRDAFKMILEQADTNKDGKLSMAECMAMYKDKNMAEKNCTFWDINKDGFITEDEYVKQASSLSKKKKK